MRRTLLFVVQREAFFSFVEFSQIKAGLSFIFHPKTPKSVVADETKKLFFFFAF